MALMVACVVAFFSLPQSKLIGYVMPAVPALAWWMADASAQATLGRQSRWGWRACLTISACIGLAAVLALTLGGNRFQHDSARPMGQALEARRQPGEPVVMFKQYVYDLPFYARLEQPVLVADNWQDPDVARDDSWRRELLDAGAFDPTLARRVLVTPQALSAALCRAGVVWVIGNARALKQWPWLARAEPVFSAYRQTLWRVDARQINQLNCAETPNGGSTDK
jgi:hypothetical protein